VGILQGALTVRRFRVVGTVPDGWRESFRDRLEEHAFREPLKEMGKEEVEGWVQVHNLLDTSFDDYNRWLYNNYAVFALRVDKKSLPTRLLNAHVQKRVEAWCAERGVERCPTKQKKEIKEQLEAEWLTRAFPRVAVTECCWNLTEGWLLLGSLSEGAADRFRKRFLRTFGLKLLPFSPLDWVDGELADVSPTALHGREDEVQDAF
jgi:recombination associated protein RdgC